jgi:hypothetical protein
MTASLSKVTEALIVGAIGAVAGAVLFSHWFLACCRPFVTGWPGSFFAPGVLIAMFIGGGAGRATALDAALGIAIQLLAIWGVLRWVWSRRKRLLPAQGSADREG